MLLSCSRFDLPECTITGIVVVEFDKPQHRGDDIGEHEESIPASVFTSLS